MNKIPNSSRSFIPVNQPLEQMADVGSDMDMDSIKSLQRPPLRKSWSEYGDAGIGKFQELCAGTTRLYKGNFWQTFKWCVERDEKNALVWWIEKSQEKTLYLCQEMTLEGAHVFAYVLSRNSLILDISIFGMDFTAESAKAFGDALEKTRNLKNISLTDIRFMSSTFMDHLAQGLRHQACMESLVFKRIALDGQNLGCLMKAVNVHTGMKLTLGNNWLTSDNIKAIFQGIKEGNTIHFLDFRFESVDKQAMMEIADCIKAASNLKSFHFLFNACELRAVAMLEDALIESRIDELHLVLNEFGLATDSNIDNITNIIKKSRSISTLFLSSWKFNTSDIKKIFNELAGNRRLQHFYLYDVRFDADGVVALATALEENTHLCKLSLPLSRFPEGAGKIFCDAMRVNTTIGEMYVDNSDLSKMQQKILDDICVRNREAKGFLRQDALLYSRMANPVALLAELGGVLANQVLMLSDSAAAYEAATIEIALSVRVLMSNTQNGPQQAVAHSGGAPQELPPGCTLV